MLRVGGRGEDGVGRAERGIERARCQVLRIGERDEDGTGRTD